MSQVRRLFPAARMNTYRRQLVSRRKFQFVLRLIAKRIAIIG